MGKSVISKMKKCQKQTKKIKKVIANILGTDSRLIEILRPENIPNGLSLTVHLYVDNEQSRERKYDELLKKAQQNGNLAQNMSDSWQLASVPTIKSLKCEDIESDGANHTLMGTSTSVNMTSVPVASPSASA